jgi:hypothetical protein
MRKNVFPLVILGALSAVGLFGQTESNGTPGLKLDFPLFDFPYQLEAMDTAGHGFFSAYANPSMGQSLALTTDMVSSVHFGLRWFYNSVNWHPFLKNTVYYGVLGLGDFILTYLPGGTGWVHEEFHRAVMTRYGVNSFNDMNTFPIGQDAVSVNSIADEDLERFKAESPADFVRMHEAGIEGESMLVDRLQRNNFFYDQGLDNFISYWMIILNSHIYVIFSADPNEVNIRTDQMNAAENSVSSRDFTGFDMAGWVYDLFRPDEPYAARGSHPSGIGINRYRKTTDLTDRELDYLKQQGYWQIFNYLSPMMFGINSIPLWNSGFYGNFAFRHRLSSFGSDVSLSIFLKKSPHNFVFTLHNHINYENWFPALEAELVDFPSNIGGLAVYLSPRILIGTQPRDQGFMTSGAEFLGLLSVRADFALSRYVLPYMEFTAKTDGWVAGNEYLKAGFEARIGVSLRFPYSD